MAKRFTDTDKWERPWFRKLPHAYRSLWLYILDKCDCAGVWYVDLEIASFMIGEPLDYEIASDLFSKQIKELDNGSRWFIRDFIPFQYGELSIDCKPHKPVFASLKKYGLDQNSKGYPKGIERVSKGYPKGIDTLQEKEKEREEDVVVFKKGGVGENKAFENFYQTYPRKVAKQAALKSWKAINPTPEVIAKIMWSVQAWSKTDQWQDLQFVPYPATFLDQKRWEDTVPTNKEESYEMIKAKVREENERTKRLLSGNSSGNGTREIVRVARPELAQREESNLGTGDDSEPNPDESDFAGDTFDQN